MVDLALLIRPGEQLRLSNARQRPEARIALLEADQTRRQQLRRVASSCTFCR